MGKVFRWTLLFVVLVIFASGAVAVYTVFFDSSDEVTMPPLREMSIIEAQAEVERLGLRAKIEQTPSSLPSGRVLTQSPEAGTRIRKGKPVVLQVSQGGTRRPIVDVRRLDLGRAQASIRDRGFDVGDIIYIKDDSRPGGEVIAQSPAAPAQIPSDKKIHLLVSQGGADRDGKVLVPDVAQMAEREARNLLTTNGLRVAAVDYVYTPNGNDGSVIGTRPVSGTTVRSGDGIRLKVATTKRPASLPAVPQTTPEGSESNPGVVVSGQDNTFTGDGTTVPAGGAVAVNNNVTVLDQRPVQGIANPSLPSGGNAQTTPNTAGTSTPQGGATRPSGSLQPASGKVAKIRYNVPPITRPLELRIEMVEPTGTKVLLSRSVKSGERINMDVPYTKECAVTYYLGGEFVWQDKYM